MYVEKHKCADTVSVNGGAQMVSRLAISHKIPIPCSF